MKTHASVNRLVSSLYRRNRALPVHTQFYSQLLEVLDKEDVKPQIYHLLRDERRLMETPNYFQEILRKRRDAVLFQNLVVRRASESVLASFENAGIDVIWLKGTRFAERFFGHCGARITSDIDILVHPHAKEQAGTLLKELGYDGPMNPVPGHYHEQYVTQTNTSNFPITVELHAHLMEGGSANLDLGVLWRDSTRIPKYQFVRELSEQHSFYATCIHAANHSLNHLKHRLDIVHLLSRTNSRVDLRQLVSQCRRDHTLPLVGMVLSSVYREFPFLGEIQTLPLDFQVNRTRDEIRSHLGLDIAMREGWSRKARYVISWFFPNKGNAIYMLGLRDSRDISLLSLYSRLYTKRLRQWVNRNQQVSGRENVSKSGNERHDQTKSDEDVRAYLLTKEGTYYG